MRQPNIAICIPAHDTIPTMFAYDLAGMTMQMGAGPVAAGAIERLGINFLTGTYIHRARQELAEAVLANGADYLLWIDADMRFPRDALVRLLVHDKSIVGINYANRAVPPDFTAIKRVATGPDNLGERCITGPDSTGLEEVEGLGGGLMLVKAEVYRALPDPREKPWFWYEWQADIQTQVGEDIYFSKLAREAGFSLFVDHDLSQDCAHIGQIEYMVEHALAFQDR